MARRRRRTRRRGRGRKRSSGGGINMSTLFLIGGAGLAAWFLFLRKKEPEVGQTVTTSAGSTYQVTNKTPTSVTVTKIGSGPGAPQIEFSTV